MKGEVLSYVACRHPINIFRLTLSAAHIEKDPNKYSFSLRIVFLLGPVSTSLNLYDFSQNHKTALNQRCSSLQTWIGNKVDNNQRTEHSPNKGETKYSHQQSLQRPSFQIRISQNEIRNINNQDNMSPVEFSNSIKNMKTNLQEDAVVDHLNVLVFNDKSK